VNIDACKPDTIIHEAFHLQEHSTFTLELGNKAAEGAADLFTRKVCLKHAIPFSDTYPNERRAMEQLVSECGMDLFAALFFRGDLKLKQALELKNPPGARARKGSVMLQYRRLLTAGRWREARALISGSGQLIAARDRALKRKDARDIATQKSRVTRQVEKERKTWPPEGKSPMSARITHVARSARGSTIMLNRGGRHGVRQSWTGKVLGTTVTFQLDAVRTRESQAEIALDVATTRKHLRVTLLPPK
jgi:hypothetical protein